MKFSRKGILSCMGLLTTLCLTSSSAQAFIGSDIGAGRANTGIAYPEDALAGANNPAGMAWVGDRLDQAFAYVWDRGHTKISKNTLVGQPLVLNPLTNGTYDAMRKHSVWSGQFGINKDICLGGSDVSVGFVSYNRNYQKTRYKVTNLLFGRTPTGLEYLHEVFAPTIAIRFCDCQSIGLSINYNVHRLKVNGIENFDTPAQSRFPGHVTNRGYNYRTGWGVTLGWRWQVNDCFAVGATYQPRVVMSRFGKYKGFMAEHGRVNIPQKVGIGFMWRFMPCATLAFDIEHIAWHHCKALRNPVLPNLFSSKLGKTHGVGFGFSDQIYYRLGFDYAITECLTVRAGYGHVNSPIRRSQTAVNALLVDTVEDYITIGSTYAWNQTTDLTFFAAYGFEHRIKGKNAIPIQLGGGDVALTEQKWAAGLQVGRAF